MGDYPAFLIGRVFLCFIFDHCERLAFGPLQKRIRCARERYEWNGCRNRHNHRLPFDRPLLDARQATAAHSFDPIVIVAGMVPFIAMILVLLLVRNTRATEDGLVRRS